MHQYTHNQPTSFVIVGAHAAPGHAPWHTGQCRRWRFLVPFLLSLLSIAPVSLAGVDVNRANIEELVQIKGIGTKTAKRIIMERARGPFESLEHLSERLSGIGPKTVIKLRAAGLCAGSAQTPCSSPAAIAVAPATGRSSRRSRAAHRSGVATPEMLQFP